MKTPRYLCLGILLVQILSSNMYSQNSYRIRERLDYMFQPLEKDRVPTGFLLDYAIDLVDFTQYDGTTLTDSNYVSLTTYEDILHSLHSASERLFTRAKPDGFGSCFLAYQRPACPDK